MTPEKRKISLAVFIGQCIFWLTIGIVGAAIISGLLHSLGIL